MKEMIFSGERKLDDSNSQKGVFKKTKLTAALIFVLMMTSPEFNVDTQDVDFDKLVSGEISLGEALPEIDFDLVTEAQAYRAKRPNYTQEFLDELEPYFPVMQDKGKFRRRTKQQEEELKQCAQIKKKKKKYWTKEEATLVEDCKEIKTTRNAKNIRIRKIEDLKLEGRLQDLYYAAGTANIDYICLPAPYYDYYINIYHARSFPNMQSGKAYHMAGYKDIMKGKNENGHRTEREVGPWMFEPKVIKGKKKKGRRRDRVKRMDSYLIDESTGREVSQRSKEYFYARNRIMQANFTLNWREFYDWQKGREEKLKEAGKNPWQMPLKNLKDFTYKYNCIRPEQMKWLKDTNALAKDSLEAYDDIIQNYVGSKDGILDRMANDPEYLKWTADTGFPFTTSEVDRYVSQGLITESHGKRLKEAIKRNSK